MLDHDNNRLLGRMNRSLDAMVKLLSERPAPVVVNVFVTGETNPEEIASKVEHILTSTDRTRGAKKV
jgi:hypothetical protein